MLIKDGNHPSSKTAKKLVIGLIPVCRQLTQFFELNLWQFNNDVKHNIRLTRPGKVASGVNVSERHIQGRQSLWRMSGEIQGVITSVRPKMKRQIGTDLQGKTTVLIELSNRQCCSAWQEFMSRGFWARLMGQVWQ